MSLFAQIPLLKDVLIVCRLFLAFDACVNQLLYDDGSYIPSIVTCIVPDGLDTSVASSVVAEDCWVCIHGTRVSIP